MSRRTSYTPHTSTPTPHFPMRCINDFVGIHTMAPKTRWAIISSRCNHYYNLNIAASREEGWCRVDAQVIFMFLTKGLIRQTRGASN